MAIIETLLLCTYRNEAHLKWIIQGAIDVFYDKNIVNYNYHTNRSSI